MSEYRLDIKGTIDLSDYSNISDYLELVSNDDKFTLTLDSADSENIDLICSMLEDRNFQIASKEVENQGKIYISAKRRR